MGCLLSLFRKRSSEDDDLTTIELGSATNAAVTCKCGVYGENIKATVDPNTRSTRIEGSGIALGSCPLDCDTGYWEVKLHKNVSNVCVGVKRYNSKKPSPLTGSLSDGANANSSGEGDHFILKMPSHTPLKEGDIVGMYWDQTDLPMLSFTVNGNEVSSASFTRIRPAIDILPAVSVKDGGVCEFVFDGNHFTHPPKSNKFKMIVCATSLI